MIHSVKDKATIIKQTKARDHKDLTIQALHAKCFANKHAYLAKVENTKILMRIIVIMFSVGYTYAKITVLDSLKDKSYWSTR